MDCVIAENAITFTAVQLAGSISEYTAFVNNSIVINATKYQWAHSASNISGVIVSDTFSTYAILAIIQFACTIVAGLIGVALLRCCRCGRDQSDGKLIVPLLWETALGHLVLLYIRAFYKVYGSKQTYIPSPIRLGIYRLSTECYLGPLKVK